MIIFSFLIEFSSVIADHFLQSLIVFNTLFNYSLKPYLVHSKVYFKSIFVNIQEQFLTKELQSKSWEFHCAIVETKTFLSHQFEQLLCSHLCQHGEKNPLCCRFVSADKGNVTTNYSGSFYELSLIYGSRKKFLTIAV